jgi:hypothetical protein
MTRSVAPTALLLTVLLGTGLISGCSGDPSLGFQSMADVYPDQPVETSPEPPPPLPPRFLNTSAGDAAASEAAPLRVVNRSEHPLRLVLQTESGDRQPALHWDFAPRETGRQGLLLSRPGNDLTVRRGDVIIAFALDGSRLYWGPYRVGSADQPRWNSRFREWQLALEPNPAS